MKKTRIAKRPFIVALLALAMIFGLLTPFAHAQGATGTAGIEFVVEMATVRFMHNWNATDTSVWVTKEIPIGTVINASHLPSDPEPPRPSHEFVHWARNRDGTVPFVGQTILGNTDVFAHWTPELFRVEFIPRGGTFSGNVQLVHFVPYGTDPRPLAPVNPDRDAPHEFMGWYCELEGLLLNSFPRVYRNMTFVAFWSPFISFRADNGEFNLETFTPGPGLVIYSDREIRMDLYSPPGRNTFFLSEDNQIPHNNNRPPEEAQVRPVGLPHRDYILTNWYRQYDNGNWRNEPYLRRVELGLAFGTFPFTIQDTGLFDTLTIDNVNHFVVTVHSRWRRAIPFIPDWPPAWGRREYIDVNVEGGETTLNQQEIAPPPDEGFYSYWYFVHYDGRFLDPIDLRDNYPEIPPGTVRAVERRRIPVTFNAGTLGTLADGERYVEFTPWACGRALYWPFREGYNGVTGFTLSDLEDDNVYEGDFEIPQNPTRDDGRAFRGWRWQRAGTQPVSRFRTRGLFSPTAIYEQILGTAAPAGLANTGTPRYFFYNNDAVAMHEAMLDVDLSFYMNNSYPTEFVAIWDGDRITHPDPDPPAPDTPEPPGEPGRPGTRPPTTPDDTTDDSEADYIEHTEYYERPDEDDEPSDETAAAPRGRAPPPGPPDQRPPPFGTDGIGSWALLNLIMTVFCVLGFAVITIMAIVSRQRRDDDDMVYAAETDTQNYEEPDDSTEQEDSEPTRRRGIIHIIALGIIAILSVVLFVLTQNIRQPMIIFDRWTGVHLMLLAATALVLLIRYAKRNQKEPEEVERRELKI